MQGLGPSTKKAWDEASKKTRAVALGTFIAAASLLGAAAHALGVDFLIGVANDKILEVVGPLAPAVGQTIASYLFSFATACGVIWFAASWGYWLASRYPISVAVGGTRADSSVRDADDIALRSALSATREILQKLENVDRIVDQTYSNKDKTRAEWLMRYRPELQANVLLLAKAGMVTPPTDELEEWQASGLKKYVEEIEPFLAKGLFSAAKERATKVTLTIEEILAQRKPKS